MVDFIVRTLYRYVAPLPLTFVSGAGAQVVTRLHALYAETTRLLHLVLARVVVQGCTDFRPGAYRRTWLTLV
jgi:hypothetical protein